MNIQVSILTPCYPKPEDVGKVTVQAQVNGEWFGPEFTGKASEYQSEDRVALNLTKKLAEYFVEKLFVSTYASTE